MGRPIQVGGDCSVEMNEHEKYWMFNGIGPVPFRGLSDSIVSKLKHVQTVLGVECFVSSEMPEGTLELWQGSRRVAVITNLAHELEKKYVR